MKKQSESQDSQQQDIDAGAPAAMAIVGMSCRFPGSVGPEAYHRSLIEGADLFSPPPRERWDWCGDDRIRVPKMGVLDDIFAFDNALFRISPREAETIDPHQRLMLEEAWLAVQNAGYDHADFARRTTGVFVAVYNPDFQFYARAGDWDDISSMYLATGSAHTMVPNRISYALDLRGPSEVVDTACSSALVAVHRAVEAIRNGECEQAIVGGVSLLLEPSRLVRLQELGLLSLSGQSAPFDRDSRGQVLGEGAAALVVKPLDRAIRDRDTIHAVVLGGGVNHQGATSGGLTRPSASAQAELIRHTYRRHRIDPEAVGYVEAHGNGGSGDLSELLAFQNVFADGIQVGSVKGNIGFLEAAGGLSQIIKVVMGMKEGVMPATRSHRTLIEGETLRPRAVRVLQTDAPLGAFSAGAPLMAGVHAYGLGGCNAHVVLGQAPVSESGADTPYPILLSAEDEAGLSARAQQMVQWLEGGPPATLPDISFTLAVGMPQQQRRAAFLVTSRDELMQGLRQRDPGSALMESPAVQPDIHKAVAAWLAGERVDWHRLLPSGRRTAVAPQALHRRRFQLPALRRQAHQA
ncbi:beta-ketoacyl synthase N-terminal-like domain-containing protein [Mesorhizobium sp. BE184]|uniref:beta-ketoacyl synthase N-terminal-like domain-containing protein n=1 Tax=Mesorhizobium sp. BE184 TaxID=2817714 RepID=UPI0028644468|nr:beta-ketoacyl synthase N-terminal-like domain-containing protein [Mesorhizobium sp. BE184]MDR7033670.1 polyketide synthase PksN [Mesorhizobium sp. BE184]